MTRARWPVALLAPLALVATLLPSAHAGPTITTRAQPVDRIELPDGWQPEGITTDGDRLYVGSLANGALYRANPLTGRGRILARGVPGRVAVGVEYDARRNLLWVAGGGTNEIRAHNALTGRLRARYLFPSDTPRFLNDLVVTRRGVFGTDSMNAELAVVPFRRDGGLTRPRRAHTLPLVGAYVHQSGFNLNGIVRSRGRLLAVQSATGKLFRINRFTGNTREVLLGGYVLTNGDGLEIRRDHLFVVRNRSNLIAELDLNRRRTAGTLLRELTSDDFDVPTTAARIGGSLWAVNARFGTDPTPDTAYWITRVPLR
jgi:hypothetical protein